MKNNKYLLVYIVLILVLIPILLWLLIPASQIRFANFSNVLISLGQIFGIVGVVLFAINILLSARLRIFDIYLNGLNDVYLKHSQLGQLAFILLLFHPLLLLPKYAGSFSEAASFLMLSNDWAKNWGLASLWLMVLLIVLTLYLRPKYHLWKITHKFFGVSLFFASLHVWLIPSSLSTYIALKLYILSICALGIISYIYKSLLGRFLIKKYKYVVSAVNTIGDQATEIRLKPSSKKLIFNPGQYVFISFSSPNISFESHPFSLTSSPNENELRFLIKSLGDYTKKLASLKPGSIAEIEGPFGKFSFLEASSNTQVWIAGGIGITPFISMAKGLPLDTTYSIDLFYCTRNRKEAIILDDLESLARKTNGRLKIIPFYSEDNGHISAQVIKKITGELSGKDYFICAPPKMIKSLKNDLCANNVPISRIFSEEFSL